MLCSLKKELLNRTPLSLSEYMEACLYHPVYGYYNKGESVSMDYITSPEISSMFGIVIAKRLVEIWNNTPTPINHKVHLVEMGSGRGTLMKQMLEYMKSAPFFSNLEVYVVEVDSNLDKLGKKQHAKEIQWCNDLPQALDGFVIVVGNEFFDALPVNQYLLQNGKWFMRFVDVERGRFFWRRISESPIDPETPEEGRIYEYSHQAMEIAKKIGDLANVILMVDYGYEFGHGDTIQAMHKGKRVSFLSQEPGTCDVTSHVNFGALMKIWRSYFDVNLTTQRRFLIDSGIKQVFRELCNKGDAGGRLVQEYARLTGPMGNLFKVVIATLFK